MGRIQENGIGAVLPEEESAMREHIQRAWDDVTGERLDWEMVKEARREEVEEVHKHKASELAPIKKCRDKTGKGPIKTRWLDINKGDRVHPDYRSRWVTKDFKNGKRDDLFAATPPL